MQSDPWNSTLVGSGVLGCELSRAACWPAWPGCGARLSPSVPVTLQVTMPGLMLGGGIGLCCAQAAPLPKTLVCEPLQEGFGADPAQLEGARLSGCLGFVCQLHRTAVPGMALAVSAGSAGDRAR